MLAREVRFLLQKELMIEWRQKHAFTGLLLYVVSTVFICSLTFSEQVAPHTWNALFWIILMFAGVNAVAKSFMQESRARLLYYYTLVSPQAVILSKTLYNLLLMMVLSVINLFFYTLFIGSDVHDLLLFSCAMMLGGAGVSSILTLVSAIASKANNSPALMAILSFPLLIPLFITIVKLSKVAVEGVVTVPVNDYLLILIALNAVLLTLSYLLFPYLWKE